MANLDTTTNLGCISGILILVVETLILVVETLILEVSLVLID